jgi:hypothetical protein
MDKIKLTKREYLGEGYIFEWKNLETGEILIKPCTKEEYIKITKSADNNPIKDGYMFLGGTGGIIKVDTENSTLGADDYTQINDKYIVGLRNKEVELTDITNNEINYDLWYKSNNLTFN